MAPPQHEQRQCSPPSSAASRQVRVIYKLFLLENARKTFDQEFSNFVAEAYDDAFIDLPKGLDTKCQAVHKLLALLKELKAESQVCLQPAVKMGVRTNWIQPLAEKRILITDVLKFGPMLQNVLLASSIAKSVQVLSGTLSLHQLKCFLIPQPAAAPEDDMIYCTSSSHNSTVPTVSSSHRLKVKEKERSVIYEEKSQADDVILQPATVQTPEINAERPPPLLLPPIQALFPHMTAHKPIKVRTLTSWGQEDNIQVQHQKQTSSQLLHFLKTKTKNMAASEVVVMEWNESKLISFPPKITSPTINHFKNAVTYSLNQSKTHKTLLTNIENKAPVFRVKRMEASGSLIYTCVIATKTELWDIGDIFTEVQEAPTDNCSERNEDGQDLTAHVQNSCVSILWKNTTSQSTEPERENCKAGIIPPSISTVTIPEFQVRKFEETVVVVSHIASPGNFYIQHADSFTKLQALVTDSWKASSSYAEQNCIPDIGTQVMGWFLKEEQWCRSRVTKICGMSEDDHSSGGTGSESSIKVEVKRLDYGDTACLSLLHIKELTAEMAILPLQAAQVSLANVMPVNGRDWSEEAVGWFKDMVHKRTLYARLYPQGTKVSVELFLEKGKLGAMRRSASLSLRLTQNGHSRHSNLKNGKFAKRYCPP